ncbi:MAG: hypothetical protein AB1560_11365 [Pseudomonadota bacterium]
MIMLPFGAQVTGKRESLLENHVLNRKDTLISDFSLLVVRIHPATRQALAGQEYHVGLAKSGGVRHFLARVEPALEFIPERVKEGFDVHHLHDVTARNMPEKHGTSFCFGKAALREECENFRRGACLSSKSWRGTCMTALTEINNLILFRQRHRSGVPARSRERDFTFSAWSERM